MASFFSALLNRLVALVVIAFITSSSLTFAAGTKVRQAVKKPDPVPPAPEKDAQTYLVVPDVSRQTYVFAKGMLEDAGFAWRVEGNVEGFAANLVAGQVPAAGTRVLDTGSPEVVIRLKRNPEYAESGAPQNASPYDGTALVLAPGERPEKVLPAEKKGARKAPGVKPKATAPAAEPSRATLQVPAAAPAGATPQPAAAPAAATLQKPAKKPAAKPAAPSKQAGSSDYRVPDFVVAGVPREPKAEMPLTARARMIGRRLSAEPQPSQELVDWWLYQHAWVVTGAKFGWKDGDRALRILIKVDEDLYSRWGFGLKSAAVARDALQYVESRKGV